MKETFGEYIHKLRSENGLEYEYFSEKIAEVFYSQEEPSKLLKAAEEKAMYMRSKNQQQGKINF